MRTRISSMWRSSSGVVVLSTSIAVSPSCCRPITVSYYSTSRLVSHPPDLLKWVRREGGFVHPSIRIADVPSYGLGLVASHDIPQRSDLIALPPHVPLRFDDTNDGSSSVLTDLALRIPGTYVFSSCFV